MKIEIIQQGRMCNVVADGKVVHSTGRIAAKGFALGLFQKHGGELWNQKRGGKMVLVRQEPATHP